MKRGIIALGLLASLNAYSQESYVPQAGEGIVYFLPKTKVAIDIIATKSKLPARRLQPLRQPLPAFK